MNKTLLGVVVVIGLGMGGFFAARYTRLAGAGSRRRRRRTRARSRRCGS